MVDDTGKSLPLGEEASAALGTIVGRGFAVAYRTANNDDSTRLVPERHSRPIMVRLVIPIH